MRGILSYNLVPPSGGDLFSIANRKWGGVASNNLDMTSCHLLSIALCPGQRLPCKCTNPLFGVESRHIKSKRYRLIFTPLWAAVKESPTKQSTLKVRRHTENAPNNTEKALRNKLDSILHGGTRRAKNFKAGWYLRTPQNRLHRSACKFGAKCDSRFEGAIIWFYSITGLVGATDLSVRRWPDRTIMLRSDVLLYSTDRSFDMGFKVVAILLVVCLLVHSAVSGRHMRRRHRRGELRTGMSTSTDSIMNCAFWVSREL